MSDFLKLLAFGATAVAAVAVAKEVIERTERGEDCSPIAVIKGIGRKIGALCGSRQCCDDWNDFGDLDEFDLLGEDDDEDFFIDAAVADTDTDDEKSDEAEFVQLEIETEAEDSEESENAVEPEEDTVEEALKSVAASFEDESDSDEEDQELDVEE